jgi:epsilon-lactone hydrolase
MPSIKGRLVKASLKAVRPIIVNTPLDIQRKRQDFLSTLKRKPPGVRFERAPLADMGAEWFFNEAAQPSPVILYFHGGAYVLGSLVSSRILASELAFASGMKVLSFEYRLAPEHPYPAALEDALAAFNYLLQSGIRPSQVVFAGESAGGGLCLAAALALKDQGMPLPAAIVTIAPWTDLTCSGQSFVYNQENDPLIVLDSVKQSALDYAGGRDLRLAYISPLYGNLEGLPPVMLQVGSGEALLDDALAFAGRLEAAGVPVSLEVYPGMWHVWHIFDIKESRKALSSIAAFIRGHVHPVG